MLTRAQKEEAVSTLSDKFSRATSVVVADYRGLGVSDVDELRSKLRSATDGETEYQVAKNSLLKLAANGSTTEVLSEHFVGPTAVAISFGDPVSAAKVLVDYAKDHDKFEIKGAMLDGKALDQTEFAKLATLPSLQELRGKLVGLIQAPAGKIARLLNEPGGQLARLVMARKDSLGEG
jgi:large subunit ribosomal protein L10